MKKRNAWSGLSPEEKAERVKRMTEARARNRAAREAAKRTAPLAIVREFEEQSVAQTHGASSIDALAALIVSVWRQLGRN